MKLKIKSLARGLTDRIPVDLALQPDTIAGPFPDIELTGPLSLIGELVSDDDGTYRLEARMTVTMNGTCARCLSQVKLELDVPVVVFFVPDEHPTVRRPGEEADDEQLDDDKVYAFRDHEIDIGQVIRDELLLAVPNRLYCRDDCQGLCPVCGQNMNNGKCRCAEEHQVDESPFSRLKELL